MKNSTQDTVLTIERGRDDRAIEVARALRDLIDAECVILFGSRCRDDWSDHSDVDLMVINPGTARPGGRISHQGRGTRDSETDIRKRPDER